MHWDKVIRWAGPDLLSIIERLSLDADMEKDGWKEYPALYNALVHAAFINCMYHYCSGSKNWEVSDVEHTLKTLGIEGTRPLSWLLKIKNYQRANEKRSKAETAAMHAEFDRLDREHMAQLAREKGEPALPPAPTPVPTKTGPLTVEELEGKPRKPRKKKS